MQLVTIMNYPDQDNYNRMLKLFIHQLYIHHSKPSDKCELLILTQKGVSREVVNYINNNIPYNDKFIVRIEKVWPHLNPFIDHHNIKFKLYNLCRIDKPFIFLDADIFVLSNLNFLWERRNIKPFIGINHQQVPNHSTLCSHKFLNSGVQIVGDPDWYNYERIEESYNRNNKQLHVPGIDQAAIYDYCQNIKYDYTHPEIGYGWNACAGYTRIFKDGSKYYGICSGLKEADAPPEYQVYINHYWNEFKPWNINCPIYVDKI